MRHSGCVGRDDAWRSPGVAAGNARVDPFVLLGERLSCCDGCRRNALWRPQRSRCSTSICHCRAGMRATNRPGTPILVSRGPMPCNVALSIGDRDRCHPHESGPFHSALRRILRYACAGETPSRLRTSLLRELQQSAICPVIPAYALEPVHPKLRSSLDVCGHWNLISSGPSENGTSGLGALSEAAMP